MLILGLVMLGISLSAFASEHQFNPSPLLKKESEKFKMDYLIETYWKNYPFGNYKNSTEEHNEIEMLFPYDPMDFGSKVIRVIDTLMSAMKFTNYSSRYIFDLGKGTLQTDCSFWVRQVLTRASQEHFNCLAGGDPSRSVVSRDYFNYFNSLPKGGIDKCGMWMRVDGIENARPGDIIVYKYEPNTGYNRTGHVLIAYSFPEKSTCSDTSQYSIQVSDSAKSGHGNDTRNQKGDYAKKFSYKSTNPNRTNASGIGIGAMWFSSGEKSYFRWNYCDGRRTYNKFVIGRLISPQPICEK